VARNEAEARVKITGKDEASKKVGKVQGSLTSLGKYVALGFVAAIGAAVAAISKLVTAFDAAAEMAGVQEAAIAKVDVQLKRIGDDTPEAVKQMEDWASALQSVTTSGDETNLEMVALALSFTNNAAKAKELTEAALDFSKGAGISFEESIRRLGRSMGGSIADIANFDSRIRSLTAEQIKNGDAIDLIAEKYSGFAANEAQTYIGVLKQMENAQGDLSESIGALKTENEAVIAIMKQRTTVAELTIDAINKEGDAGKSLANTIETLKLRWDEFKLGVVLIAQDLTTTGDKTDKLTDSVDWLGIALGTNAEYLRIQKERLDQVNEAKDEAIRKKFAEEVLAEAAAMDELAAATRRAKEDTDAFYGDVRDLGIKTVADLNDEILENNETLERARERFHNMTIELIDLDRIEAEVTKRNIALTHQINGTADATDRVATSNRAAAASYNELTAATAGTTAATLRYVAAASQAAIYNPRGDFEATERTSGRSAAVQEAIDQGGKIVQGGRVLELPNGGSRLVDGYSEL